MQGTDTTLPARAAARLEKKRAVVADGTLKDLGVLAALPSRRCVVTDAVPSDQSEIL